MAIKKVPDEGFYFFMMCSHCDYIARTPFDGRDWDSLSDKEKAWQIKKAVNLLGQSHEKTPVFKNEKDNRRFCSEYPSRPILERIPAGESAHNDPLYNKLPEKGDLQLMKYAPEEAPSAVPAWMRLRTNNAPLPPSTIPADERPRHIDTETLDVPLGTPQKQRVPVGSFQSKGTKTSKLPPAASANPDESTGFYFEASCESGWVGFSRTERWRIGIDVAITRSRPAATSELSKRHDTECGCEEQFLVKVTRIYD